MAYVDNKRFNMIKKKDILGPNFRMRLEAAKRVDLLRIANYNIIEFVKIDLLLKQYDDYPDFMTNIFNLNWDEEDAIIVYPELLVAFEAMEESELNSYFSEFAWKESVINALMHTDDDSRIEILENL